ncbi:MAG: hypothetical protein EOO10_14235 [Chitinophagaceae bacterium]|nr:MAG: hypothetical protein EOO10_14235 [Chitinophagaceae bacterium]
MKSLVCWILLLQMINLSVDTPDSQIRYGTTNHHEDLSINDIESLSELIAEGLFDIDVPESDEDDVDSSSPAEDLYFSDRSSQQLPLVSFSIQHVGYYLNSFPSISQKPLSPPPKSA